MYESGIFISARRLLLMDMAALWIWLAQSRVCFRSFLAFSDRPPRGMHGTGNHHFSSGRWVINRKEPARVALTSFPCSAYQNSVSLKLSNISCEAKFKFFWIRPSKKTRKFSRWSLSYLEHCVELLQSWKVDMDIWSGSTCHHLNKTDKLCQKQAKKTIPRSEFGCETTKIFTSTLVPFGKVCNEGKNSTM